ncbi:hypothetical protein [Oleiharenicola lentus]|uniref:hypothetical protein n=1 Tax=Oleiharenicola lentus TaxID=2508720 RepID=UPI003F676A12
MFHLVTTFALYLVAQAKSHPLVIAATGASSGLFTWLVTWGEHLTLLFRVVGGFFGCALTVLCFILALPRAVRFYQRWRTKGLAGADGTEPPFLPPA